MISNAARVSGDEDRAVSEIGVAMKISTQTTAANETEKYWRSHTKIARTINAAANDATHRVDQAGLNPDVIAMTIAPL